jgi:hypothetical protein
VTVEVATNADENLGEGLGLACKIRDRIRKLSGVVGGGSGEHAEPRNSFGANDAPAIGK